MFFTLKSSILVISGYLRTVQVAPGHPVMPCESLGKSLQTCLSQDKSGFPDVALAGRLYLVDKNFCLTSRFGSSVICGT
jgi:hypothetical protein